MISTMLAFLAAGVGLGYLVGTRQARDVKRLVACNEFIVKDEIALYVEEYGHEELAEKIREGAWKQ